MRIPQGDPRRAWDDGESGETPEYEAVATIPVVVLDWHCETELGEAVQKGGETDLALYPGERVADAEMLPWPNARWRWFRSRSSSSALGERAGSRFAALSGGTWCVVAEQFPHCVGDAGQVVA